MVAQSKKFYIIENLLAQPSCVTLGLEFIVHLSENAFVGVDRSLGG